jgi:hypothetical protein
MSQGIPNVVPGIELSTPDRPTWQNDSVVIRAGQESRVDAVPVLPSYDSGELTDRDRRILAFERQWWKYAGAKEQAIRELFEMSGTRYYQVLNALIDRPEALVHDPMLVKRLRRLRATRQRTRHARRLGLDG